MQSIEHELKKLAMSAGADLVGITSRELLSDGPPSADPRYLLESANSVISFAVSLDMNNARDFISKKARKPHSDDRRKAVQRLYRIGDDLADALRSKGYDALQVEVNNNFRPEEGAFDITEMTEFHPEFSHRYAALAAGLGRLGWSGNLLSPEHGALLELGSVLTSASLEADSPIPDKDHPCDNCKVCSLVCPVEMIDPKKSIRVTIAGITETIAEKQPHTCCWIGCTGYEGSAASRKWSNWSPYRLEGPLPREKEEIDALCIQLQKADPQMQEDENSFSNYRRAIFDSDAYFNTVCGFCRNVCFPRREDRLANRSLLLDSGTAALRLDGSYEVAGGDVIEIPTPFEVRAVISKGELTEMPGEAPNKPDLFPLDREVVRYIIAHRESLFREIES